MVGLAILAGIFFVLVVPALAIAALVQVGGLRGRLEAIEQRLRQATPPFAAVETAAPALQPAEAVPPLPPRPIAPKLPEPAVVPQVVTPPVPPRETPMPSAAAPKIALEEQLGSRIFVWVGGIALALAGAFLVKYSIEQGWLDPATRCFLGGLLGLALLVGGEFMRRHSLQIAQSLSAAGVAVLYASLLAAIRLYELIEPAPGFLLVAGLTAFAIGLAMRQGPFVGLLGLACGFVTPAIVRTDEPNAMGLFVFLFAMQLGTQVLVRRRGWWWLAPIAVAGGLLWVCIWLNEGARNWADDIWPGLFLLATAAATAWSRRSAAAPTGMKDWDAPRVFAVAMQFGAILVMGLLVIATGHDSYGWTFFGILSAMLLAIARFQPENESAAAFAAAIGALLLLAWPSWPFPMEYVSRFSITALAIGGIFAAGGFIGLWGAQAPMRWALLSAVSTGLYLIVAYWRLHLEPGLPSWGLVSVILAALHLVAAERVARYRLTHPGYNDALGAHALAVCGLLALAIPMELEHAWIAVAWSILLPAIAWIEAKLDIPWLRRAAWVAAGLVLVRLLPGPWLYDFPPSATPVFNWILYGYGIPFVAFGLAAWLFRRRADDLLVRLIEAGAIVIGFLLVTLEVHHSFHGEAIGGDIDFREFASFNLSWLLIAFALLQAHRRQPRLAYLWGARAVTGIAVAGLVFGLMLILNPIFNDDPVGEARLFNWLIPAYALPAALLAVLAVEFDRPENRWTTLPAFWTLLGVLALIMGFAFVSLETRQWFQGPILSLGEMSDAESYAYSAVWLLYGVGLLAAGILRGGRALRYASMAVIMLTVSKVFLLDAAGLSGLYRVASFLGLGICLIGIGYAYQRYVFRHPEPAAAKVA